MPGLFYVSDEESTPKEYGTLGATETARFSWRVLKLFATEIIQMQNCTDSPDRHKQKISGMSGDLLLITRLVLVTELAWILFLSKISQN
ncbi:hypothetical protein [Halobacillus dabanensis]|uniref:hypothetical protein n=1 Tax=Halobacillus dabanensis TaxID=240302 RepID=UPI000944159B|nr:hypothetical protein [Halobacillus dabanensis]